MDLYKQLKDKLIINELDPYKRFIETLKLSLFFYPLLKEKILSLDALSKEDGQMASLLILNTLDSEIGNCQKTLNLGLEELIRKISLEGLLTPKESQTYLEAKAFLEMNRKLLTPIKTKPSSSKKVIPKIKI